MDQDKIGAFIKSIRLENNLTQKELADKLGVTYQAVSKWEIGKNIPDISILKQISNDFNVNIDELLNGEKDINKKKNTKVLSLVVIFVLLIAIIAVIILIKNNNNDFEFKTISSKCTDFRITGSAAYNKDKTSIYISNIEFCGEEDKEVYEQIECKLYENENETKTKISSCTKKNNITLEEYLKDANIQVDNYSLMCKKLTSTTLSLEIEATTKDHKKITYTIPIKLNDTCK